MEKNTVVAIGIVLVIVLALAIVIPIGVINNQPGFHRYIIFDLNLFAVFIVQFYFHI